MKTFAFPAKNSTVCDFCDRVVEAGEMFVPKVRACMPCFQAWAPKVDEAARKRAAARRDTMAARFAGFCKKCKSEVKPGQRIVKGSWNHAECEEALAPEVNRADVAELVHKVADRAWVNLTVAGNRVFWQEGSAVAVLSEQNLEGLLNAPNPRKAFGALFLLYHSVAMGDLPVQAG